MSTSLGRSVKAHLQKLAMDRHRFSLQEGQIDVLQWKGHSVGVDQCRMKTGFILTGVGDKVMRLWSAESYKCLDEYSIPDSAPLIDFDFDESKRGMHSVRGVIYIGNGHWEEELHIPLNNLKESIQLD
ncbi:unnamed protein product [Thlaspi arvense]|uniref:Uncharacterized protein n=1 Tax=Thlaspi arvense TaxID=13288 RepID=A0AAU9T8Y9_THLAR|nr:unnamed protein product [Thlaspi arvense]